MQAHDAIDSEGAQHEHECVAAKAAVCEEDVAFFQCLDEPAGEGLFVVVFVADGVAQHCSTVQAEEADHFHDGEPAACFLLAGLGPAGLVSSSVGHGEAGAVEHAHAAFAQPEFVGEDAVCELRSDGRKELGEHFEWKSFAGLAVCAGVSVGRVFFGPIPPRLRLADRFPASARWGEHLEEEYPECGRHAEQALAAVGSLPGPLQRAGGELFFEHVLEFAEVLHLRRFPMRSASEKQWSKCGKEWCFQAHAASVIRFLPLPLNLISRNPLFIHFPPCLRAIRVCLTVI